MNENTYIGKPCRYGHSGLRYKIQNKCFHCCKARKENFKEKTKEYNISYYKKNRWKYGKYNAIPRSKSSIGKRAILIRGGIKKRSRQKGLSFNISIEWVRSRLEDGCCEITKIPFDLKAEKRSPYSPSVDRIDSNKGYTEENCRLILWSLNASFGNWGEDVFRDIALKWINP